MARDRVDAVLDQMFGPEPSAGGPLRQRAVGRDQVDTVLDQAIQRMSELPLPARPPTGMERVGQAARTFVQPLTRAGEAGGAELLEGIRTLSPFGRGTEGPVEAISRFARGASQLIGAPFAASRAFLESPAVGVPALERRPVIGGREIPLSARDILGAMGEAAAITATGLPRKPPPRGPIEYVTRIPPLPEGPPRPRLALPAAPEFEIMRPEQVTRRQLPAGPEARAALPGVIRPGALPPAYTKIQETVVPPEAWRPPRRRILLGREGEIPPGARVIEPPPPAREPVTPSAPSMRPVKAPRPAPVEFPPTASRIGPPPVISVPPAKVGRPVDLVSWSLDDPKAWASAIRRRGGLRPSEAYKGEMADVPWHLKNKGGLPPDELIDEVARARGVEPGEVERRMFGALSRTRTKAAEAAAAETPMGTVPREVYETLGVSQEEWARMSPAQKQATESFALTEAEAMGPLTEAEAARPTEPAPSVPRFERTEIGDQGLVPGTPPLSIPPTPLRPGVAQKPLRETPLFGTLEPEQEKLFGLVPPVPIPSPREEDKDTWQGRLQQAAQVAGLSLPLLGILGRGRFRPPTARIPPGRPPEVLPQFRREAVRPPVAQEPPAGAPGRPLGAVPPTPGRPPTGPPSLREPGPLPGVPDSLLGRAWRGTQESGRAAIGVARGYYSPIISRWERMGEAGKRLSQTYQNKESQQMRWYGQNVEPLMGQLGRLTPAERANFVAVAEEGAAPMNARVAGSFRQYEQLFGPEGVIPREAMARNLEITEQSGQVRPWRPIRERYFPHEFAPDFVKEVIRPGSAARQRAAQYLMDSGQAMSPDEAEFLLSEYFGPKYTTIGGKLWQMDTDRFVGGLERAREINLPGYITDPALAVGMRGWKVAKRFAELDHYGRLDALVGAPGGTWDPLTKSMVPAHGIIGDIQKTQGVREARKAYELFHYAGLGHELSDVALRDVASRVQSWQAFVKLPLAAIANSTQFAQTAARTTMVTTARALATSVTKAGRQYARDLGVISEMSLRDLQHEMAGYRPGRATDFVLKPFNMVERWDRIVGANAGRMWADRVDQILQSGRSESWLRRELDRLNFSPEEIAARLSGRRLVAGDQDRIAWAVSDQTQFLARRGRQSEMFKHPIGRLLGQFKTFSMNQGRLMRTVVWEEAKRGNLAPLARVAVLFPLVGELAGDLRSLVGQTERPDFRNHPIQRLLDDFFFVGGLGLASDFVQAMKFGARGTAEFIAGPFFSDVLRAGTGVYKTVEATLEDNEQAAVRQLQGLGRFAVRQVPYVGPALSQYLRTDSKGEQRARMTWKERLGIDAGQSDLRRLEEITRKGSVMLREADKRAAQGDWEGALGMVDDFNRKYGTGYRLSRAGVRQQMRRQLDPEVERRRRIPKAVRPAMTPIPLGSEVPAVIGE